MSLFQKYNFNTHSTLKLVSVIRKKKNQILSSLHIIPFNLEWDTYDYVWFITKIHEKYVHGMLNCIQQGTERKEGTNLKGQSLNKQNMQEI